MINFRKVVLKKLLAGVLGLSLMFSGLAWGAPQMAAAAAPAALTVTGDGVEKTVQFILAELEALPQATYTYSGYNHWPSLQLFKNMQGPTLKTILAAAGLKDNAVFIRVKMNEQVYSEFTIAQLLDEPRYYFPDGEDEANLGKWPPTRSDSRKSPVETMIALSQEHGKLIYGQCAINEPTCCKNQMLSNLFQGGTLEVLTAPPAKWEAPQADPAPGTVAAGTPVTLQHGDGTPYHALVYYTLDGSEPGYGSSIANISYPTFQPEMNKPVIIDKDVTIKTRTIGMGKLDSETAVYTYKIGTPGSAGANNDSGQVDKAPGAGQAQAAIAPVKGTGFVDIENHPARAEIMALAEKGIINGVTATEFKPEDNITRAQVAILLTAALKIAPDKQSVLSFEDVPAGSWYHDYVVAAVKAGLMTGYSDSTFAPDENVNREQITAMIARALKMKSTPALSAGTAEQIISRFKDKGDISPWAVPDIALAVSLGIASGSPEDAFAPQKPATRAEVAVMVLRMCNSLNLS